MAPESPTAIGRLAEQVATNYLMERGYQVLARNWRTRYCEIDIVAHYQGVIHFVEVKYRRTIAYGSPIDYITRAKRLQMIRAAAAWSWQHHSLSPYQIDVIGVVGNLNRPEIEHIASAVEA